MQQDANEDDQADVVIVQERGEARRRLAVAGKPLVINHQAGGSGNREEIPETEFSTQPYQNESGRHDNLHAGNHEQVYFTE